MVAPIMHMGKLRYPQIKGHTQGVGAGLSLNEVMVLHTLHSPEHPALLEESKEALG